MYGGLELLVEARIGEARIGAYVVVVVVAYAKEEPQIVRVELVPEAELRRASGLAQTLQGLNQLFAILSFEAVPLAD